MTWFLSNFSNSMLFFSSVLEYNMIMRCWIVLTCLKNKYLNWIWRTRMCQVVQVSNTDRMSYGSCNVTVYLQVAVPPGPKALNWFCCQPELSVYPLFFLSKNTDNPTYKSLYLNGSRGVFGIGAAIYFTNSASCTSREQNLTKRWVSFLPFVPFLKVNLLTE